MEVSTESPKEVVQETHKYELSPVGGLDQDYTIREEDGVVYIDVNEKDEVIEELRATLISASKIRDLIKANKFEEIKPFVPEETYEIIKKEYDDYVKRRPYKLTEFEKEQKKSELERCRAQLKATTDKIAELRQKIKNIQPNLKSKYGGVRARAIGQQRKWNFAIRDELRKAKELNRQISLRLSQLNE